jgi:Arc/MetJ family transcription regulator
MMRRCEDVRMRTTIDLPDDLHRQAMSIARDTARTLSETVADLMRRALEQGRAAEISRSPRTGLPVVRLGTVITTEDVRALEDDDQ